jgi:transposase
MKHKKTKQPPVHPQWATKYRKPGTELRNIKGKYYLYSVSSRYDAATKRTKKITGKILGRITQDQGFVESGKRILDEKAKKGFDPASICVKEQGFSSFITQQCAAITKVLQQCFPEQWLLIQGIAYCRLLFHSPIKNMPFHLSKSMLMHGRDISVTDKKISDLLRQIGNKREAVTSYMQSFIQKGDYVLADMTNIFNASHQISLTKEGYNSDLIFDTQFNLLYLYSSSLSLPVFYRLFAGNMREVKGFKMILQESGIEEAVIIADKGFYSKQNVQYLESNGLEYIIPLKRDNTFIDYSKTNKTANQYIKHQGRFIWYAQYKKEGKNIFLFKDEKLMVQEEKDYLNRIETHPEEYSIEKYHQIKHRLGTIALFTNLQGKDPSEVFTTYKSRNEVEVMFDGMKNILDADRTYMQNEDALQGWMFINHIALQWYYILYKLLKSNDLLKKRSVNDILVHLREVKKVRINQEWLPEPITASTEAILQKLKISVT